MKLAILLLTLQMFSAPLFSQINNACGEVIYFEKISTYQVSTSYYSLKFNSKLSLYEEQADSIITIKSKPEFEENAIRTYIPATKKSKRWYLNKKNEFYFLATPYGEEFVVEEDNLIMNWNLENDTKIIGKYLCNKANVDFRGRSYIAWYTTEIPVSYGPWKFAGLPGLILEIYDDANEIHKIARNIVLSKNCVLDVSSLSLNDAVSIDMYLEKKERLKKEAKKRMMSRMPAGAVLVSPEECDDCKKIKPIEEFDK